jgi:hypothetical protein
MVRVNHKVLVHISAHDDLCALRKSSFQRVHTSKRILLSF